MNKRIIITDLLAGLTVSFAALALGAAFGIMSGRGAFAGMIAAAVIPIITGLFGGTRLSVSGPTKVVHQKLMQYLNIKVRLQKIQLY